MDKPWKVILAFMGIFLAGTVSGVLIAPKVFGVVAERRGKQQGLGIRGVIGQQIPQLGPQLFRRVTEQLALTPDQREKIKPIETRTTEELRGARRESQRSTELVLQRMQDDISAILTPEQRVKYDELIAKGRERIQNFMKEQDQRGRPNGREGRPGGWRDAPPRDATPAK